METAPDCGCSVRCCLCSRECASYRKLKKHYKREHQEHALLRCLFCKFVTVSQSDMKKHKKREHPQDRFTCSHCTFSTKSWKRWVQHDAAAHPRESLPTTGADPQENSSCQRLAASRPADNDLLLGLSSEPDVRDRCQTIQQNDSVYPFPAGNVTLTVSSELVSLNVTHSDTALKSSTRKNVSEFGTTADLPADCSMSTLQELQCPRCAAGRQPTDLEPDDCPNCGPLSSHPPHSLPSVGDPTTRKSLFICEVCKKQFAKKINLTYHLRTHTDDRPFQCQYCEYTCCQKTTLQQHLRGHLGMKPYKCDICDYSTAYRSNLVFHAVTHSIDKPFSCDFCHKRFKRKDHMSIHVKRKHADVV